MLGRKAVACAFAGALAWLSLLAGNKECVAAEPVIRNLSLRGLQAGSTTTVTIDGSDLLPNPKLMLTLPITEQKLLEGGTATRVQFEVTLDANTTPGLYNLRLANESGISQAQIIAIDRLPQLPFAELVESVPCSLHGNLGGSQVLKTKVSGKAGQTLMLEVEAQRLGSKLRPVLHLRDAQNKQLAYAWPSHTLAGDVRLITKLPADGEYTVELHDTLYAVPGPGFFRLKLGEWKYADLAYPAAVQRGTNTQISLLNEAQPTETQITLQEGPKWQPVPWPASDSAENQLLSGWQPKVLVSDTLEMLEAPAAGDTLQELSLAPVAINGRLQQQGEVDRYKLSLTPGTKVRLETYAQRLGAPLDTEIELQNEQGGRLAINDDGAGTDSGDSLLEYTPPENINSAIVVIRDVHGRGDDKSIYRLVVTPLDGEPVPDFRLIVSDDRQQITAAGHAVLPVMVERKGYQGAIRIESAALPAGVELQGALIPAEATGGLLTLQGSSNDTSQIITQLRGVAIDLPQPITRWAECSSHALAPWQPWLAHEVGVAVTSAPPNAMQVTWETPAEDFTLPLGAKLELPLTFQRAVAEGGPVRVTLLTSQNPPLAGNRPDLNKTLRQETANLEVAVNPQAKATADALAAADKVLQEAQVKQQAATDAATKADAAAAVAVNAAREKLAPLNKNLADANAALKAADQAKALAQAEVTSAQSAVTVAANQGDEEKAKAAEQLAAAQVALQSAAQLQASAAQQAKDVMTAQAAAAKMLADAEAAAKTAKESGARSVEEAAKVVADATAKRDAAKAAAEKANAEAKYEAKVSVIVPGTLPELTYDLAFRLEMLSANKQQVLETVYTPVRKVQTLNPLLITLDTEANFQADLDPAQGASITLAGKLQRLAGMKSPATITLEGLPSGVPVPSVNLPPEKADFELEIKFPANVKPGEYPEIKVIATAKMEPGTGELIRSQTVPVSITINEPDKKSE